MDYIFGSAIQGFKEHPVVLISYDISCQWFTNLDKRMAAKDWPKAFTIPKNTTLIPAIPKLHEPMHIAESHQVYSLNYIPGVGLSDMETPERVWGFHNPLGTSTRTQGWGTRHLVLDSHFSHWNWMKYASMGPTLLRKYRTALANRNLQVEAHRGLSEAIGKVLVAKWEAMCIAYEEDPSIPKVKPCPYDAGDVGTRSPPFS